MEIKKLEYGDGKIISELIESTNIKHSLENNSNSGFLLYNYGEDNYNKRLKLSNNYSFGCFENNKLVGCVLAYSLDFLIKNNQFIKHEEKVINHIKSLNREIIWGEQIALEFNKRRRLLGKLMMKSIYKEMISQNIYFFSCMVALYPNLNKAGLHFMLSDNKKYNIDKTILENDTVWAILINKYKIYGTK